MVLLVMHHEQDRAPCDHDRPGDDGRCVRRLIEGPHRGADVRVHGLGKAGDPHQGSSANALDSSRVRALRFPRLLAVMSKQQ